VKARVMSRIISCSAVIVKSMGTRQRGQNKWIKVGKSHTAQSGPGTQRGVECDFSLLVHIRRADTIGRFLHHITQHSCVHDRNNDEPNCEFGSFNNRLR
jgi:hypothetical protein